MDEWLSLLGGATLLALGAAFGWAGSFLTNRQAAKEAARIRDELRRHEQEREADSVARARNRETRQAIEALMELADEGLRLVDSGQHEDLGRDLQFHRVSVRVQARLGHDDDLSKLIHQLTSLDASRFNLARTTGGLTPESKEQWKALLKEFIQTHQTIVDEMHRRDLPW